MPDVKDCLGQELKARHLSPEYARPGVFGLQQNLPPSSARSPPSPRKAARLGPLGGNISDLGLAKCLMFSAPIGSSSSSGSRLLLLELLGFGCRGENLRKYSFKVCFWFG